MDSLLVKIGTYSRRSRLYVEKAPGGISVISFCSNRLKYKVMSLKAFIFSYPRIFPTSSTHSNKKNRNIRVMFEAEPEDSAPKVEGDKGSKPIDVLVLSWIFSRGTIQSPKGSYTLTTR